MTHIGEYLKKIRLKQGLTYEDVIEASSGALVQSTISRIENGKRKLSVRYALYLSEIYKIDLKELAEKDIRLQGVKLRRR
jgi:DNA phosphorothioation-dependent restriction protein DptG